MSDYLKQLVGGFGMNGTGEANVFFTALVITLGVLLVGLIVWSVVRRFRRRDRGYDWDEGDMEDFGPDGSLDLEDSGGIAPYDKGRSQSDEVGLFGSGEERQVQLESDVQGLSHRLTVTTVLIPLLFVIVLVFFYLDMRHRLRQLENPAASETKVAQALYEDISQEVEGLSKKLEDTGKAQAGRLKSLENRTSAIKTELEDHGRWIEEMAALKGDGDQINDELKDRIEKAIARLSVVEQDLTEQGRMTATLSKTMDEHIRAVTNARSVEKTRLEKGMERIAEVGRDLEDMRKRFLELELNYKLLSEAKVDKQTLETLRAYQDQTTKDFTQRIQSLEADVTRLAEQFVRSASQGGGAEGGGSDSPDAVPDAFEGSANIFEQDIPR